MIDSIAFAPVDNVCQAIRMDQNTTIRQAQVDKLEHLLIYAMRSGDIPSAEAAAQGLVRLGAREIVEQYAELYARRVPPFEAPRRRHRQNRAGAR